MRTQLEGTVILVTGGCGSVGRAVIEALTASGATPVSLDLKAAFNGTTEAEVFPVDVGNRSAVIELVEHIHSYHRRIDGLVNCAAVYGELGRHPVTEIPESDWDRCMTVNLKGVWNCCCAVIPHMRRAHSGSIVNIASAAALYGMPYAAHYVSSKSALMGLTKSLARELGQDNIRVNAVAPSAIDNDATREFFGDQAGEAFVKILRAQAIQKPITVDDVAEAVTFFLSDSSKMITGQVLSVCGGSM